MINQINNKYKNNKVAKIIIYLFLLRLKSYIFVKVLW